MTQGFFMESLRAALLGLCIPMDLCVTSAIIEVQGLKLL